MTSKAATLSTSDDLMAQIGALMEANAQLQRSCSLLIAHVANQRLQAAPAGKAFHDTVPLSRIDSVPQSARASILGAGVPIPHRPYKGDNLPRSKVLARTKARLLQDQWPDCEDTDVHASRLTEAMLRLGMEDLDNFATEASRLNCSNMAITATLVSSIVATFLANTYSNNTDIYMRIVNALWLSSLSLSLATATICMLVSEWLTWSTSQELRDTSMLYRMVRTAFRSSLMHFSIFLFFAGLFVLMWNISDIAVCILPTIFLAICAMFYTAATIRAPVLTFLAGKNQWDDKDFRGLRVQVWTPFSLTAHYVFHYIWVFIVRPLRSLVYKSPTLPDSELTSAVTTRHRPTAPLKNQPVHEPAILLHNHPLSQTLEEDESVVASRDEANAIDADEAVGDADFAAQLRATRLRRLAENEMIMRPGQRTRRAVLTLGEDIVSNDHEEITPSPNKTGF